MVLPMMPQIEGVDDELRVLSDNLSNIDVSIQNVQNELSALNLSAGEISISSGGGGSTIWQGEIDADETAVVADSLDFVRVTSVMVKSDSDVWGYGEGGVAVGQSFQVDSVSIDLTLGGEFRVTAPSSSGFLVVLSFVSYPLLSSGIVGPRGAAGATGATGAAGMDGEMAKTEWAGLTFSANWSNLDGARTGQYRSFDDVVQLRGLVDGTGWSTSATIAYLPSGYRPSREMIFGLINEGQEILQARITSAGQLFVLRQSYNLTAGWVSLDGINFSIA
jgi:hypothetical protein